MDRLFPAAFLALIFINVVVFPSPAIADAQSRIDCNSLPSQILQREVHYCVYLPSSYSDPGARAAPPDSHSPARTSVQQRYPVLYFLHGLGDNEQTLFNSGGWTLIDDLRRRREMGDFLIVAPEGRNSFYINSADGRVRYSDFFLREFIPHIEAKYRIRAGRAGRAISGVSMGGYGALRLAFAHPALFSAVSAQSPALMTESPKQIDIAARSGVPLSRVLMPVFGSVNSKAPGAGSTIDVAHWNENSPFLLARKNSTALKTLAIYFNCGENDNYGFEKGAAALHQQLQAEGIKHEYHSYPGDHSLSYFLSHFEEIMEFHSRAFGLLK